MHFAAPRFLSSPWVVSAALVLASPVNAAVTQVSPAEAMTSISAEATNGGIIITPDIEESNRKALKQLNRQIKRDIKRELKAVQEQQKREAKEQERLAELRAKNYIFVLPGQGDAEYQLYQERDAEGKTLPSFTYRLIKPNSDTTDPAFASTPHVLGGSYEPASQKLPTHTTIIAETPIAGVPLTRIDYLAEEQFLPGRVLVVNTKLTVTPFVQSTVKPEVVETYLANRSQSVLTEGANQVEQVQGAIENLLHPVKKRKRNLGTVLGDVAKAIVTLPYNIVVGVGGAPIRLARVAFHPSLAIPKYSGPLVFQNNSVQQVMWAHIDSGDQSLPKILNYWQDVARGIPPAPLPAQVAASDAAPIPGEIDGKGLEIPTVSTVAVPSGSEASTVVTLGREVPPPAKANAILASAAPASLVVTPTGNNVTLPITIPGLFTPILVDYKVQKKPNGATIFKFTKPVHDASGAAIKDMPKGIPYIHSAKFRPNGDLQEVIYSSPSGWYAGKYIWKNGESTLWLQGRSGFLTQAEQESIRADLQTLEPVIAELKKVQIQIPAPVTTENIKATVTPPAPLATSTLSPPVAAPADKISPLASASSDKPKVGIIKRVGRFFERTFNSVFHPSRNRRLLQNGATANRVNTAALIPASAIQIADDGEPSQPQFMLMPYIFLPSLSLPKPTADYPTPADPDLPPPPKADDTPVPLYHAGAGSSPKSELPLSLALLAGAVRFRGAREPEGDSGNGNASRAARITRAARSVASNTASHVWNNKASIAGGAVVNLGIKALFGMTAASILTPTLGVAGVALAASVVGGMGAKLAVKTVKNRSMQVEEKSTLRAFRDTCAEVFTAKGLAASVGFGFAGVVAGDLIKMGWDHLFHHATAVAASPAQTPQATAAPSSTTEVDTSVDASVIPPPVDATQNLKDMLANSNLSGESAKYAHDALLSLNSKGHGLGYVADVVRSLAKSNHGELAYKFNEAAKQMIASHNIHTRTAQIFTKNTAGLQRFAA